MQDLLTQHLEHWTTAQTPKTKGVRGRGRKANGKFSPHGIKKLRELILELAVRGKLVPQDSSDEPASVLLDKISKERTRLIKEGKIKKQKKLPEISEEEKPFELPMGWEWVQFGEISEIERGGSPRPIKSFLTDDPDGLNWIKIGDTNKGGKYITSTNEKICREGLSKTRMVYPGDFLLTNSMSFGRPYITKIEGCIHDGWLRISPPKALDKDYLYVLLSSPYISCFFKAAAAGAVVLNLNVGKVRQLPILIPPIREQHRIVTKVDELMALCDRLEQQQTDSNATHQTLLDTLLATLTTAADHDEFTATWQRIEDHFHTLFTTEQSIDQLKQTILQLAVMGKLVPQDPNDEPASVLLEKIAKEKARLTKEKKIKKQKKLPGINEKEKPFGLPTGWAWEPLGNMVKLMDAGWSPACPPEPSPSGDVWGVLKTTAVQIMEYREIENKVLPPNKEPRPQYEVKEGDILITRAGPKNRVAISCLVDTTRPKLMISDKIIRFHLFEVGILERYISLCLNAGATANYLEKAKSGMAESQMNISQSKLKLAPIPLCPVTEQQRIVAKVDELLAHCDQLQTKLTNQRTTTCHLADTIVEQIV